MDNLSISIILMIPGLSLSFIVYLNDRRKELNSFKLNLIDKLVPIFVGVVYSKVKAPTDVEILKLNTHMNLVNNTIGLLLKSSSKPYKKYKTLIDPNVRGKKIMNYDDTGNWYKTMLDEIIPSIRWWHLK